MYSATKLNVPSAVGLLIAYCLAASGCSYTMGRDIQSHLNLADPDTGQDVAIIEGSAGYFMVYEWGCWLKTEDAGDTKKLTVSSGKVDIHAICEMSNYSVGGDHISRGHFQFEAEPRHTYKIKYHSRQFSMTKPPCISMVDTRTGKTIDTTCNE